MPNAMLMLNNILKLVCACCIMTGEVPENKLNMSVLCSVEIESSVF